MNRSYNLEKQKQIKLKDINHLLGKDFSLNDTFNSSPCWPVSRPTNTDFSLILGDSFTLEKDDSAPPRNLIKMTYSAMRNKKNDLNLTLQTAPKKSTKPKKSSTQKIRVESPFRTKNSMKGESRCKLNRTLSTACNLQIEDDDSEEMDRFLKQKEGFKKHCRDDSEEEGRDPNFLSDDEVESIIKEKMKILDIYNVVVLKKGRDDVKFRMSLMSNRNVSAIVKLQRRFRGYQVKKAFLKAIWMNKYVEHRKKYLQHKECVRQLESGKKVRQVSFTEAFFRLIEN